MASNANSYKRRAESMNGKGKNMPHIRGFAGRIRKMRTLEEVRGILQSQADILAERYGVQIVGIFGSYARGQQNEQSDLDLLVEYLKPISLLELIGAELYLSDVLGLKVDLVPRRAVRKELREAILREAIPV